MNLGGWNTMQFITVVVGRRKYRNWEWERNQTKTREWDFPAWKGEERERKGDHVREAHVDQNKQFRGRQGCLLTLSSRLCWKSPALLENHSFRQCELSQGIWWDMAFSHALQIRPEMAQELFIRGPACLRIAKYSVSSSSPSPSCHFSLTSHL